MKRLPASSHPILTALTAVLALFTLASAATGFGASPVAADPTVEGGPRNYGVRSLEGAWAYIDFVRSRVRDPRFREYAGSVVYSVYMPKKDSGERCDSTHVRLFLSNYASPAWDEEPQKQMVDLEYSEKSSNSGYCCYEGPATTTIDLRSVHLNRQTIYTQIMRIATSPTGDFDSPKFQHNNGRDKVTTSDFKMSLACVPDNGKHVLGGSDSEISGNFDLQCQSSAP